VVTIHFQSNYDTGRVKIWCTTEDIHWPCDATTGARQQPTRKPIREKYLRGSKTGGPRVEVDNDGNVKVRPIYHETRHDVLENVQIYLGGFMDQQLQAIKIYGGLEPSRRESATAETPPGSLVVK
jgi:hypothetical protein